MMLVLLGIAAASEVLDRPAPMMASIWPVPVSSSSTVVSVAGEEPSSRDTISKVMPPATPPFALTSSNTIFIAFCEGSVELGNFE